MLISMRRICLLVVFCIIFMVLFIVFSCFVGLFLCIVKLFYVNNVYIIFGWFCKVVKVLGVKFEFKYYEDFKNIGFVVYVVNY